MPDPALRLLLVEDDPADVCLVLNELRKVGYHVDCTHVTEEAAFTAALSANPDVVLCDWNMPAFSGERALEIAVDRHPDVPVVIVSGSIGEEAAARAIKLGAVDYLLKDRLTRLGQAVRQARVQRRLRVAERQAREALRASEERYRALAEGVPQIVWTSSPDGAIDYLNVRAAEYTGLSVESLHGWDWGRVTHPDDLSRVHATWSEVLRSGNPQDFECRFRRADGQYRWYISRQVPIRGADGAVTKWVGTCTDIHDQKLAAEELTRDAQILAGVRDAVVVTDPNGVVSFWNEGAVRLYGRTAGEMVGRPYADRFPEAVRAEAAGHARERSDGEQWQGEYEDYRKDGSRVWVDARVRRFDRPDGTPAGILCVSHDITGRKRLEEQFRQSQKMEAVGRLAGGIAHDFNNLLTVINGYADLLLVSLPSTDQRRAAVASVRDAGERAAGLTAQLLAFSRKTIIAPRVFDLTDMVLQAERLLRRVIGEDVVLTVTPHPRPCLVYADPNQVDQVILNLAVNARDAMPTGGRLALGTRVVELPHGTTVDTGELPAGGYVELTVEDSGCGMSDEVKGRIFEPFYTTKGPGKGTGLGLATVFGIVQQGGGGVAVESAVGRGTTFRVLFPQADAPKQSSHSGELLGVREGKETVLLVEDEDAVRELCRIALEAQGYTVVAAASGRAAIAALATHTGPIHLLITDVVMPEMSGRELAEVIRSSAPGIRVLYVSGYTDDAVVRHGVSGESVEFLQKPFTPLGLARKVRSVLDSTT